jgi:hypothetical protein
MKYEKTFGIAPICKGNRQMKDGDKFVAYSQWVIVYRVGVGDIVLHSAPMLGINPLAASPWLKALDQMERESG